MKTGRTSFLLLIVLLIGPFASVGEGDAAEPTTVILALHSGNRTGENLEVNLGWGDKRRGIPILYPDGEGGHWNSGWEHSESTRDDVAYLLDLVEDYDRVLIYGQSQGGMMAYRLACEHPERIDRIAVESGAIAIPDCDTAGVEVTHWHGKLDTLVPKQGNADLWPLWEIRNEFSEGCQTEVRRKLADGAWTVRHKDCPAMAGPFGVETRVYPDLGHTGYPDIWPTYAWWWLTH